MRCSHFIQSMSFDLCRDLEFCRRFRSKTYPQSYSLPSSQVCGMLVRAEDVDWEASGQLLCSVTCVNYMIGLAVALCLQYRHWSQRAWLQGVDFKTSHRSHLCSFLNLSKCSVIGKMETIILSLQVMCAGSLARWWHVVICSINLMISMTIYK